MLQNWLKPLPKSIPDYARKGANESLGQQIVFFQKDLPDLKKVKIALIGTDEASANAVRMALYSYAAPFTDGAIADLGNLRKADTAQLVSVIYELITGKIVPVLIGGSNDLARAQFLAYQEAKAVVNWTSIDEVFRFMATLEPLVDIGHPMLFHYALIGSQAHLMPPSVQKMLEKNNFEVYRLGRSRTALEETEPILRDADLLSFHLNALKNCEAPGVHNPSVSGFFLEEACQLTRYAGMSDKLTSFGVYGLETAKDINGVTAQSSAQLIWYFLDGFFNRKGDYPVSFKGLTEYVVDMPEFNYQLTFWKSTFTGRWWLQVPIDIKRKHQRHRLIPCSFQDYQAACRQELPDRFFRAFKRY